MGQEGRWEVGSECGTLWQNHYNIVISLELNKFYKFFKKEIRKVWVSAWCGVDEKADMSNFEEMQSIWSGGRLDLGLWEFKRRVKMALLS